MSSQSDPEIDTREKLERLRKGLKGKGECVAVTYHLLGVGRGPGVPVSERLLAPDPLRKWTVS